MKALLIIGGILVAVALILCVAARVYLDTMLDRQEESSIRSNIEYSSSPPPTFGNGWNQYHLTWTSRLGWIGIGVIIMLLISRINLS